MESGTEPGNDTACVGCGEPSAAERCPNCGAAQAPGGYRVERVLAQTAHSRMYAAIAPDGRRVALKELVFALVPGAPELDAFQREVSLLQELDVEGVPRFLASFQEGRGVGTRLYLAQEFVDGTSLADRLRAGRFEEDQAIEIARKTLPILDRLHSRLPPVVHRDVKPANLLEREGGDIVLVDFGSARVLQNDVTFRSTLVGTYGYMPPEQLAGSVDATADLYALGATLAHLLTGKAPNELAGDGLAVDVARLPVSPPLRKWLAGLLAPVRTKRFPSAREALRALEALEAPAPPPAALQLPTKPVLIATASLVALGLVGLFLVEAGLAFDDTPPIPHAPARTALPPRKNKAIAASAPAEALPPVEVVSLERVLAPHARAAFWLEGEVHAEIARHRSRWDWQYNNDTPGHTCAEAPQEHIEGFRTSFPGELAKTGARLELQIREGYRYGICEGVRMRLFSDDGQEMPRVSETSSPEWVIPRNVPRYVLRIDRAKNPLEVRIDLENRRIALAN